MFAVSPKTDCPHVAEHVSPSIAQDLDVHKACSGCGDKLENWICCKCGEIGCSRYQKGHMGEHNEKTKHSISASFSDFSFWCYSCESYIKHPSLSPIWKAMTDSKFPPVSNDNEDKEKEDKDETDLIKKLKETTLDKKEEEKDSDKILSSVDIDGVVDYIKQGKAKNIIVMTGAGISVAAGIPDFRTPGTGLYDNLQKYNLPDPTAVFNIDYFKEKPEAFYLLAKELYPGNFVPTPVHYFIRLLHEKGLLLRNFTQNIDTLERIAKIPAEVLVEAHGAFGSAHCIKCKDEYDCDYVKNAVFSDTIPRCTKEDCQGFVKPDIVFFGESLPKKFFPLVQEDFPKCDLLIVIGTSLQVHPFASLIKKVNPNVPRLLINRESVGESFEMNTIHSLASKSGGFIFQRPENIRDVRLLGDCQDGVKKFAELLGWGAELEALVKRESEEVLKNSPIAQKNAANADPAANKTTVESESTREKANEEIEKSKSESKSELVSKSE